MVLSADSTDSPYGAVRKPQPGVRHRELGIDFDGAPKKRDCRGTGRKR